MTEPLTRDEVDWLSSAAIRASDDTIVPGAAEQLRALAKIFAAQGARLIDRCGACGNTNLRSVLDLGTSPATCAMVPVGERRAFEEHYPLELLYCDNCTLAQLSVVVDPVEVFAPDYPYRSGNSPTLHKNFEELAQSVKGTLGPYDLVVDIGANDGTLLSKFDPYRTVGVEPTEQAERISASELRCTVYQDFFTEKLAGEIREDNGQAKVITACNVMAHVADIDDVMRGIDALLADDGILVVENHDLASVVDGGQWDTVYHEHLRFYSPYSFKQLLNRHGFGVYSYRSIPTHGGSFRMVAGKGQGIAVQKLRYDFGKLALNAADAREDIRREVACGCYGIGATARATTIINYCGLDVEDVECVCEVPGSDKIGHYIPGTRIPVVDEGILFEERSAPAVLFSWHLADVIVPKLRERGYAGRIIVPLPELRYI